MLIYQRVHMEFPATNHLKRVSLCGFDVEREKKLDIYCSNMKSWCQIKPAKQILYQFQLISKLRSLSSIIFH